MELKEGPVLPSTLPGQLLSLSSLPSAQDSTLSGNVAQRSYSVRSSNPLAFSCLRPVACLAAQWVSFAAKTAPATAWNHESSQSSASGAGTTYDGLTREVSKSARGGLLHRVHVHDHDHDHDHDASSLRAVDPRRGNTAGISVRLETS